MIDACVLLRVCSVTAGLLADLDATDLPSCLGAVIHVFEPFAKGGRLTAEVRAKPIRWARRRAGLVNVSQRPSQVGSAALTRATGSIAPKIDECEKQAARARKTTRLYHA